MANLRGDGEPLPPTLLQIWSPVMAGVSISLLILLVPSRRTASRRRGASSDLEGEEPERWSRRLMAIRVIAVSLALILFNVVGAVSGPRPGRSYIPLEYEEFFGGTPRMLIIRLEDSTVQRRPLDE